jgi:hypothetical protein
MAVAACRTECLADEKASREQISREQKAMLRGQGICSELLSPKIALLDDRLTLTATKENVLARRGELPPAEITRLAILDERLRAYREHFKLVRSAETFDPTLSIDFDPALELAKAASVLTTAAYAGYPRSNVHVKELDLAVQWWVPPPSEAHAAVVALCIEPQPSGRHTLRFEGREAPAREAASLDALGGAIDAACASVVPCARIVGVGSVDGATMTEVARVAKAALSSRALAEQKPSFLFATTTPMASGWSRPGTSSDGIAVRRPCAR